MNELVEIAGFLKTARRRMRYGKFSRLPVELMRLEWKGRGVECDWLMRPADPWDRDLPRHIAEEHETLQALCDAMTLRDAVFASFPDVATAELRMFRIDAEQRHELMMTGTVHRSNETLRRVVSIAMRARLCGFQFTLTEGVLKSMSPVSVGCS
ncbi:MAG TPA: hypothetical protein VG893_01935 [Terracidiphilus sp.]|nr:hypothetical protein [Terracidiphilus sp.]